MSADISISGFIKLTLVDAITGAIKEQQEYHNVVTPIGKQLILDRAIAALLQTGSDTYGKTHLRHAMFEDFYFNSSYTSSYATIGLRQKNIACVSNALLNVEANELAALSASSSFVQVTGTEFNMNQVVGLASNAVSYNTASSPANKEGVTDHSEAEYVLASYKNAKHWRYDAGIGTGNINVIAMMPASCLRQYDGPGIRFEKMLDKCIGQNAYFASYTTAFCPPGVTGFTANDEVLLNFNTGGVSKWKYNITTGVMSEVADTAPFWVPIMRRYKMDTGVENLTTQGYMYIVPTDFYIEGGYLYVIGATRYSTGTDYSGNGTFDQVCFCAYTMSTKALAVYTYTRPGYFYGAKAFKKPGDTNLYITMIGLASGDNDIITVTKSAGLYYNTLVAGVKTTVLADLIAAMPSVLQGHQVMFGNYGSNYIMYVPQSILEVDLSTKTAIYGKYNGYVFTDLDDIEGSIIDCIYNLDAASFVFSNVTVSGVLGVTSDRSMVGAIHSNQDNVYNNSSGRNTVINGTGTYRPYADFSGLFLSLDKWWGNMISYKKLDTPITKTANDVLYVTYGYEVGAGT